MTSGVGPRKKHSAVVLPAENLVKILESRGRFRMPANSFKQFGFVH